MSEAQIIAVFRFHPAQKTVDEMDKLYVTETGEAVAE